MPGTLAGHARIHRLEVYTVYFDVMVVALSGFDRNGWPEESTRRRLDASIDIVKRYGIPYLALSGGPRGVNKDYLVAHPEATEARLGRRYLHQTFHLPPFNTILLDYVSLETVGNVVLSLHASVPV